MKCILTAAALSALLLGCNAQKYATESKTAADSSRISAAEAQKAAHQAAWSARTSQQSSQNAQIAYARSVAMQMGATERQGENGVIEVVVSDGLLFATNSAELTATAKSRLDEVVNGLKSGSAKAAEVRVKGYTDDTGTDEVNKPLSLKRAENVANYLEGRGISKDRVSTQGFGSQNPVGNEQSAEGRAKNRRVEIIIRSASTTNQPAP